jgi:hypothetical protein
MIWQRRRIIASFTALLVGVAVVVCACRSTAAAASAAASDEHACCRTGENAPATPDHGSDACAHCGHLTLAPAKAPDVAGDLDLAAFGVPFGSIAFIEPASLPASADLSSASPPLPDPLSRCCALRL